MKRKRRESRYVTVARIAYDLAKKTLPQYSHPKSKHLYSFQQLAACVLLMFYVNKSYRDMEEWLLASDKILTVLELTEVPDHSTLQRAYHKLRMKDLEQMQQRLLEEIGPEEPEDHIAVDTTGFSPSQASLHYITRSGRKYRAWVKGAYAVGTRSQFILASGYGRGPSGDSPHLAPLRRKAGRYGRHQGRRRAWLLLADAGFEHDSLHPCDLVPVPRRTGKQTKPVRQARADLVDQARLDGLFGQRWKVETVNSVIKRMFGSAIRSRSVRLQNREAIVKALVYNIHR
jgi:hypothetical protein